MLIDLSHCHYNHLFWWVYLLGKHSVLFSLSFGCDWYVGILVSDLVWQKTLGNALWKFQYVIICVWYIVQCM